MLFFFYFETQLFVDFEKSLHYNVYLYRYSVDTFVFVHKKCDYERCVDYELSKNSLLSVAFSAVCNLNCV